MLYEPYVLPLKSIYEDWLLNAFRICYSEIVFKSAKYSNMDDAILKKSSLTWLHTRRHSYLHQNLPLVSIIWRALNPKISTYRVRGTFQRTDQHLLSFQT